MNSLVYLPVQASCPCAESFRLRLRDCRDDLYSFRGGRKPIRVLRWEVCDLVAAASPRSVKAQPLILFAAELHTLLPQLPKPHFTACLRRRVSTRLFCGGASRQPDPIWRENTGQLHAAVLIDARCSGWPPLLKKCVSP
jgi:hypothetical protein